MLTLILLAILTQTATHQASFKSFNSADRECSRYLGCQRRCAVRCRGLVTRFLNQTSEIPSPVIESFYEPARDDYMYRARTTQCLRDVRAQNNCELVRKSVQCYDEEFGLLDSEGLRYIPFTDVQHLRVLRECEAILWKSSGHSCVLRCLLIREGLYSDRNGPRVERIAVQISDLGEDVKLWSSGPCIARLQAERIDKCTLAARIASECLSVELVAEVGENTTFRGTLRRQVKR